MFSHLVYFRRGHEAILGLDPATDLLVEPAALLMWRHVRQGPPVSDVVYGGVYTDKNQLSVIRFSHELVFDGVEEWLKGQAKLRHSQKLGFHAQSEYRSILRPLYYKDREKDLDDRIALINKFFSETAPKHHKPWRRGSGPITDEWIAIKHAFIDCCLDTILMAA